MPTASTGSGKTPEEQLIDAIKAKDNEEVDRLIGEVGADVCHQDEAGMSPLMHAADAENVEAVGILLEAGCPWHMQDKEGYTAGEYGMGNPQIVDLLLNWGVQAELVLGASDRCAPASTISQVKACNADYLEQKLHYSEDGEKLLDADGEAVMMGWEGPLMVRHAEVICAKGGDVLNVGFGLGLVDMELQKHNPRTHTIIEAHPDVYAHAVSKGWGDKPGVKLLLGRWQDVLPQLGQFDGIFFDTYGEYYEEMRTFHEQLPRLLKPGGIYSFFNGLAPDNIFFHMVYGRLVQLELSNLGISTKYTPMNIKALDPEVWEGVKNKYWHFETYFLPTCTKDEQLAS